MATGQIQIDLERGAGGFRHLHTCTCSLCGNKRPIRERILEKTKLAKSGCHEWTGKIAADGYGIIRVNGKDVRVHRISFHLSVRPIERHEVICHRCDNRRCIRTDHLFVGSRADNNRDMALKGRARNRNTGKPTCDRGHPFTPENTLKTQNGERQCRECRRQRLRRYRAARRAA